ncbi:SMP-30/gluconolactonase/LRE family protein [Kitasatospora sp. NPDC048540]|uniref:SMP-30/gluconolactonase/LRE family protein n=1 Tax=Kitasatospora sp. NPDC048540 TaxID=3155634 RepID=UPI0033FD24D9
MRAEPADLHRLDLGEGPTWDAATGRLYWIGIPDRRLRWLDHRTGATAGLELPVMPGALAPARDGRVLLATERGFELLDTADGTSRLLAPVEADRPDRRMNDGACDPYGRMVAGTMRTTEPLADGRLHRLEPDGTVTTVLGGLAVPNGLAWPEPDRLWYIDSPTRRIDLYEYPEHGPVGPLIRSLDVSHLPGVPDGMTLDADGNLWVAFWDGAAVHCLTPTGRLLATVEFPVPRPTSCTFAGPDLTTLYITTARTTRTTPDTPDDPSGRLFRLDHTTPGRPDHPWNE